MLTKEKLIEASDDLQTIEDVINGPADLNGNGGVTSRLGTSLKTIARIIADMNNTVASAITAANSSIATMIANGTTAITDAINNAYAQVVTGGAPILSSESAAQLPAIESSSVTDRQIVNLKGWHTANDGGSQTLIYDATSEAAVNGGTVFPGPGGTLSFDPVTGEFNGTVGTGRYLALSTNKIKPEQFGAKGDGVTDDSAALKRCMDYAVFTPHCSVELAPKVSYGLGSTLVIGQGNRTIEIYGHMGEVTLSSTPTFKKLNDILAIEVRGNHYLRNLSIEGRASALPQDTPPNTETKPGLVIRRKSRIKEVSLYKCGGLNEGTEPNTDGYAIGVVQEADGNANYAHLQNISMTSCKGGLYVGRLGGGRNINSIKAVIDNFSECTGIGVNADDGVSNHFEVKFASASSSNMITSIFRFNFTENYAFCQYAERNIHKGVIFTSEGKRNTVEFLDGSKFIDGLHEGLGFNVVRDLRNRRWHGLYQRDVLDDDYGPSFDLFYGSTVGDVNWTSRIANVSSFARMVNIALILRGSKVSSGSGNCRLNWDLSTFPFSADNAGQGLYFLARLNNSSGGRLVYLTMRAANSLEIRDSDGTVLTYNDVIGDNDFSIHASITLQRPKV